MDLALALSRYFLMIAMAFLMAGVIVKVKSFWAGRYGPPVLQPLYDAWKLLRKGQVVSGTTSAVFRAAPSITLASVLSAGLVLPIGGGPAVLHFSGDFVFFAYVLALGRFFAVLGAMDTGNSLEGMGASRDVTFAALLEPAFFVAIGTLSMLTGLTSVTDIYSMAASMVDFTILASIHSTGPHGAMTYVAEVVKAWSYSGLFVPVLCSNVVLMISIIVDTGRMPVDDPAAQDELTMIHGEMVLDNSGPDMAMINVARAMKIALMGTLVTGLTMGLVVPTWVSGTICLVVYAFIMLIVAAAIGLIESVTVRMRLSRVPQFVLVASSIALIVLSALMIGRS